MHAKERQHITEYVVGDFGPSDSSYKRKALWQDANPINTFTTLRSARHDNWRQ